MPRQNPPRATAPDRPVGGVGVVAEGDLRPGNIVGHARGREIRTPEIVESEKREPLEGDGFVPQHPDPGLAGNPGHPLPDVGHPPPEAVIVVSQDSDPAEPSPRKTVH